MLFQAEFNRFFEVVGKTTIVIHWQKKAEICFCAKRINNRIFK